MNVKLLRKIKKHILEEPGRLRMSQWSLKDLPGKEIPLVGSWGEPDKITLPACGTVGCIAGWAAHLSRKTYSDPYTSAELLGIGQVARDRLFMVDDPYHEGWPKKYAARFKRARTNRGRASATAARIDHFIKTKGAE